MCRPATASASSGATGAARSTLLRLLAKREAPDAGRVTHTGGLSIGWVGQADDLDPETTVRHCVVGDRPEHDWAGDAWVREVLAALLGGIPLGATVGPLSGGERRRVALASVLVHRHGLIILDEPTNHLDVEAIDWLGRHLAARPEAVIVVTHDRWFLDTVATQTWEVVGAGVESYEGGYSAYVLAKAERSRIAAAEESRRQNLLRKELAWLRRGPPARTSKPKFRIAAAEELIAGEPPARDSLELAKFASARLGRTVVDLEDVSLTRGGRTLIDRVTWQLGPGDRIGLVGVNGAGKTSLLRLLDGELRPMLARSSAGARSGLPTCPRRSPNWIRRCACSRPSKRSPAWSTSARDAKPRRASCSSGSASAVNGSGRRWATCPAGSDAGFSCCGC